METIVTEIIEILKSNSDIIEREKQLHAYVGQVACQLIATAFQHIDDALWEEQRKEGARSKRRDARTLVTLYGEVTVPRRLVQTADGRNLYPLDLADAWKKETSPVRSGNENRYKNAVRNALKKSKRFEHVAAKNGRILMDCPASSAIGSLSRRIGNGGMLA